MIKQHCFIALGLLVLLSAPTAAQDVIAFWDFNDGFVEDDETPQIIHAAALGNGTAYQQRADTDGNGKGGNSYTNAIFGINADAGRSIAWDDLAKSGDNDAELFLSVSTLGFTDINISFDIRGNDDNDDGPDVNDEDGVNRYDLKYSLSALVDVIVPDVDPTIAIKDFDGDSFDYLTNEDITTDPDDFVRFSYDLSAFTDVNNQANFSFRIDDIQENDSVRFDNILISGIAVPEPSALTGLLLLAMATTARRRKSDR